MTVTFDPLYTSNGTVLSGDNLTVTTNSETQITRATEGKTGSGKWYWEFKVTSTTNTSFMIGIVNENLNILGNQSQIYSVDARWYYSYNGGLFGGGENNKSYGASATNGAIIGMLLDLDSGSLTFSRNGVAYAVAYTNIDPSLMWYPAITNGSTLLSTGTISFNEDTCTYASPSNYKYFEVTDFRSFILNNGEYKTYVVNKPTILTPIMTSANTPSGVVTASSFRTGDDPYKAFDRSTTIWSTATNTNQWIQYEFPEQVKLYNYSITSSATVNQSPKDFNLLASTNGVDYVTIDERRNIYNYNPLKQSFRITNSDYYKYYKLEVLNNNGNSVMSIVELEMVGIPTVALDDGWNTVSTEQPTLTQFKDLGMMDLSILNKKETTTSPIPMNISSDKFPVASGTTIFTKDVTINEFKSLISFEIEV